MTTASATPLLSVRDLSTRFGSGPSAIQAVHEVSFDVGRGEVVAVVGESGSGKSVTMASILGLLARTGGRVTGGSAAFDGRDLLTMPERELRRVRGRDIGVIFQDPTASFNPVQTIGRQIAEAIKVHDRSAGRAALRARVLELLRMVNITDPESRIDQYPHEFSGGMRQRAMIAVAMANRPALVIADEPTTALDVTIQAQILELLDGLRHETGSSVLLVTHDLGVVAELADRVVVMYAGRVVETAAVDRIFAEPRHPYTVGLLASRPQTKVPARRLPAIGGQPPTMLADAVGCAFRPRCDVGRDQAICAERTPPLLPQPVPGQLSACHFADRLAQPPTPPLSSSATGPGEAR
ncbi:ABC transporter ATP-binding protein [Jiangella mangrovi]|uniref:Oligopeptide/dipeptide ABC transporter ATP-binding protein n=1 Tax=Jiangella mangrovi TaxID=1524084 RepID=A0A7W9GXI7_9ACTN|nr:ABC transporter ATP-binding protein [Jiangella mangrovi]MBB5791827.1 oligopeptide/dipeptide ABC transporter ATP-binding protein [Jiangella mangrovi]